MEIFGPPILPDVSIDQRTSNALIKRSKKLRWMGMHNEEEWLRSTLAESNEQAADSVIAGPCETD
jgi:hypothetical protein